MCRNKFQKQLSFNKKLKTTTTKNPGQQTLHCTKRKEKKKKVPNERQQRII